MKDRLTLRPYSLRDYEPFLEVMRAMWPQFSFTPEDLEVKDMVYAGKLSRWGVWEGDELLACCNLYQDKGSIAASWFYRPNERGTFAVAELADFAIEQARQYRVVLTSRVLESHPLWAILQARGFVCRDRTTDWVLNIKCHPDASLCLESDASELEFLSLEQFQHNSQVLQQIYELELAHKKWIPPWFTIHIFQHAFISTPSIDPQATTAAVRGGQVLAYALVLRDEQGENKIRKILAATHRRVVHRPLVEQILLRYILRLSVAKGHKRLWASTGKGDALSAVLEFMGFEPKYTWLAVIRNLTYGLE